MIGNGEVNHLSKINNVMNIPIIIHFVTVVAPDATVIYQQIYINNDYAAIAPRQTKGFTQGFATQWRDNLLEAVLR